MRRRRDDDLRHARGARRDGAHDDGGRDTGGGRRARRPRRARTGSSRSRTRWPCGSSTSRVLGRGPASRDARHVGDRELEPGAHVGVERVERRRAARRRAHAQRRRRRRRSAARARAARASPPSRTDATISATASATEPGGGHVAAHAARRPPPRPPASTARRSTIAQRLPHARHEVVDRGGLELVRDRVGDQPRGRGEDLLAHDEPVLAQRRAGRREVDDPLDQARSAARARPSP